jgi:rhamnosyltransferase
MNYTWYGPVGSFDALFEKADNLDVDFWGVTEYGEQSPNPFTGTGVMRRHIQSHWIAVRRTLLESLEWANYWAEMPVIKSYEHSILRHESMFTRHFEDQGFKSAVLYPAKRYGVLHPAMMLPEKLLEDGCPIVKRRAFFHDPVWLDSESVIGKRTIDAVHGLGFPTKLIWKDLLPITQPRILHTNLAQLEILSDQSSTSSLPKFRIAVVVHVYFIELFGEILEKLDYIREASTLFVSTKTHKKASEIREIALGYGWSPDKIEVRIVGSNAGRDMSGLFIEMRDVIFSDEFDLVFKVHGKKSAQNGPSRGDHFRRQQLENLLHSQIYVNNLLALFAKDEDLGIVFPPMVHIGYPTMGHAWFANKPATLEYAKCLGVTVPLDDRSPLAPFGTMFVCRPEVLQVMAQRKYSYKEYGPPESHADGSLSHVQERFLSYAAASIGLKTKTVANLDYISISHTSLEFKLDAALGSNNEYYRISRAATPTAALGSYIANHLPKLGRVLQPPWRLALRIKATISRLISR